MSLPGGILFVPASAGVHTVCFLAAPSLSTLTVQCSSLLDGIVLLIVVVILFFGLVAVILLVCFCPSMSTFLAKRASLFAVSDCRFTHGNQLLFWSNACTLSCQRVCATFLPPPFKLSAHWLILFRASSEAQSSWWSLRAFPLVMHTDVCRNLARGP